MINEVHPKMLLEVVVSVIKLTLDILAMGVLIQVLVQCLKKEAEELLTIVL